MWLQVCFNYAFGVDQEWSRQAARGLDGGPAGRPGCGPDGGGPGVERGVGPLDFLVLLMLYLVGDQEVDLMVSLLQDLLVNLELLDHLLVDPLFDLLVDLLVDLMVDLRLGLVGHVESHG